MLINYYSNHLRLAKDIICESGLIKIPRLNKTNHNKQYWIVNFTNEIKQWKSEESFFDCLENQQLTPGSYNVLPFGYKILEKNK